jgi:hypothetical protein
LRARWTAIASLRQAGYLGPILVDSGNCGQDIADLLNYSAAVFNSDPQKNVMFALHVYGNADMSLSGNWYQQLARLSASSGWCLSLASSVRAEISGPARLP